MKNSILASALVAVAQSAINNQPKPEQIITWEQFINSVFAKSETSDIITMTSEFENLQREGSLGTSKLRSAAMIWCDNINSHFDSMVMKNIALECYRHLAKKYIEEHHG